MIKKLAILFFVFSIFYNASSKHIVGSEITYDYLGSNKYNVYTQVFRNCSECKFNGVGGGSSTESCNEINDLELWAYDSITGNFKFLATLSNTRISITDKTILCNGEKSKCQTSNTYSYGIEQHLFKADLDLTTHLDKGYRRFKISITIDSRSAAVNLSNTPKNHFNFCYINTTPGVQQSSPKSFGIPFNRIETNNAVIASSANQLSNYDSVAYTLDTAHISESAVNEYPVGYAFDNPVMTLSGNDPNANPPEGLTINNLSGQIAFTPTSNGDVGVFVIKCSYFKKINGKSYLIGYNRKDFEYEVVNGSNKNPYFLGGNEVWNACENVEFIEDINTRDDKFMGISDTVIAFQQAGETPVLKINVDTLTRSPFRFHTFSWTPPAGSARDLPYSFTIVAQDSKCPKPGYSAHVYRIKVGQSKIINTAKTQTNCNKYRFRTLNSANKDYLRWSMLDSNKNEIANSSVFDTAVEFTFPYKGKWYVKLIAVGDGLFCPFVLIDSVNIANFNQPTIDLGADKKVCYNSLVNINSNVSFTNGPVSIEWKFNDVKITHALTSLDTFFTSNRNIKVKVTDNLGCFVMDTLAVIVKPGWNSAVRDSGLCINSKDSLYLGHLIDDTMALNSFWFTGSYVANNRFGANALPVGFYNVYLSVLDTVNCTYKDTVQIEIGVPFKISYTPLSPKCANQANFSLTIASGPFPAGGIWSCPSKKQLVSNDSFIMGVVDSGTYQLKYQVSRKGCNVDTFIAQKILPIPPITLVSALPDSICQNAAAVTIATFENTTEIFVNGSKTNKFLPSQTKDSALIFITNTHVSNGCVNTYTKTIFIDSVIDVSLNPIKDPVCFETNDVLLQLSNNKYAVTWSTNGNGNFMKVNPVSYNYQFTTSEKSNLDSIAIDLFIKSGNTCPNKNVRYVIYQNAPFVSRLTYGNIDICELGKYRVKVNGINHLYYDSVIWSFDDKKVEHNGFSNNEQNFEQIATGNHKIAAKVYKNGCFGTIDSLITIYPRPKTKVNATPKESYSARYPIINFEIVNQNTNYSYTWSSTPKYVTFEGSNPYKFEMPGDTGIHTFNLTIVSDKGCRDSLSYQVFCLPKDWILIPNAFSPNNDGPKENDLFKAVGRVTSDFKLEIFNVWGEKVFVTEDIDMGWDGFYKGVKCRQGNYLYKVTFVDDIGRPNLLSGTLILLP